MDSMVGLKLRQSLVIVRVVSSTDYHWQKCLDTIPHDFYHLPGYLELEAKRYHATPEAIIIEDDGKIFFLPYLIRDCSQILNSNYGLDRVYDVISPYGYPGILVNQAGQNIEFINKCLELTYHHWRTKNICSAFIRLHPVINSYIDDSIPEDCKSVFCKQGDVVTCDLTKDIKDIWRQIRANHRTKINKLNRAGFTVKIGSMDEYLDVFIDIYRETMDRVHAIDSYYFTRDYFDSLSQILGDRIKICIVEIDGQIVATSLITELSGIVQYHLGGTRTAFLPRSPATIMFKYMIEWAKQRNNHCLNLGGGLGGRHDSLYHFKAGFSDESKSFTTIKTIVDRQKYDRLIDARSKSLGVSRSELENTSFFPAYRSS
jgi:Acetyltransferase (GNAT) domain